MSAELRRSKGGVRTAFWLTALALGGYQAWAGRYFVQPDSMSYLDNGMAYLQGNWAAAISTYWSPLYAVLAALPQRLFHFSPRWEFPAVHAVNLIVFLVALWCFEYFWSGVGARRAADDSDSLPLGTRAGWVIGYSLFLLVSLVLVGVATVTPDLLISAITYLAAGLVVRVRRDAGYRRFALLGIVLGLGYLAKAPMFLLAWVFLGVALVAARPLRRALPRTLVAVLAFALVSGPFIAAFSHRKGQLTFGDSARLNYAWFVNRVPFYRHWQGGPPGTGAPEHTTRKVLETPPIYEFESPVAGTYPPWYDPAYWYAGVRPHLALRNLAVVFARQVGIYGELLFYRQGGLLAVALLLLLLTGTRAALRRLASAWEVWLPGAACLGMYALIHVEPRFIAGAVVLLWGAVFSAIRLPAASSRRVASGAAVTVVVFCAGVVLLGVSRATLTYEGAEAHWRIAEELQHMGINAGDPVACICDGTGAYWAHLAGVRIVAEIPSSGAAAYWAADGVVRAQVAEILARTGAKILVTENVPAGVAGWTPIGDTGFQFTRLRKAGSSGTEVPSE